MDDAASLRAQFPVLERVAYLNSGTDGPVPAAAAQAARDALAAEVERGRMTEHFQARMALQAELRAAYARVVGAPVEEIALTTSTSDGLGRVLAGLDLGPGDEVITSDEEHPGLVGPLVFARARGATVRVVPLRDVADAVGPRTTLVAVSHVSWVGGEVAPAALAETGVPVVLDGAQGAGAVPVDVRALGCAAYAASGQKWLCGADGTGFLWIDPGFAERVRVVAPSYVCFEDTSRGLDSPLKQSAARYDAPSLSREAVALSLAAVRVLESVGWEAVHARAAGQAAALAAELAERGREVAPRGRTTLVSWSDPAAETTRDRLHAAGVAVRFLPGRDLVRASVGAWNDAGDLDRLLAALG
jgi:selenocysteine lyase/cysteine desulfurase